MAICYIFCKVTRALMGIRGVEMSRLQDASRWKHGRFWIDAEMDHNREYAAYADCSLFGLNWAVKLRCTIVPMLYFDRKLG